MSSESDSDYSQLSESMSDSFGSESEVSDNDDSGSTSSTSSRTWCDVSLENPPAAPPRFPFQGTPGCNFTLDNYFDPLAYFLLFFDLNLITTIVTETNRFAMQQARASTDTWEPVSIEEMFVFLAICIMEGILYKPDEKMYWSRNELFLTPSFSKLMTKKKFLTIKKYLHFADTDTFDPETHPNPKLNKIWPLIEHLNFKFSTLYTPEEDITVDESLLLFKGRLSWKQYIRSKRARFGIKFYNLCESSSGYLWNFTIYTGKGTVLNEKYKNMPLTTQIVLTLVEPLLGKGYCLTTDNFYTSPQLADYLLSFQTDYCGTLRLTRRDVPNEIQRKKLKKGETVAMQRGKVLIQKWQDKKTVTMLSTFHSPKLISTQTRSGTQVMKPECVLHYNQKMGGVDLLDQHIHNYHLARKRGKKYYKKIFFQLLDLSIYNAHVLYKKNGGERNNLSFRMNLVDRLVMTYRTETMIGQHSRTRTPGPLRLVERHFPAFIPPTEKKANPTRCCAVCCNRRDDSGKKIRKETRYWCPKCEVALCPAPCFEIYHTKLYF
ncbi:piggyBac transposable element-derived protein 4-like [Centruroides sculpturatus]|uniref:piggyBac transposable element-derived protein 4-like n=1 Tax=Centruroides sculpturatus TaxID=218467 RepID=UPI000C6ED240|nr:piggyBac transposable element-derived protein 4-like [Centruroides sculpturatus]XP_023240949.1 piggyBac transposable element-derived protein 4-like [Centruroides sculpturatus]XP_023240950.1 piggyBac transposable element-derived protein 4-like [Centruroides sculpturatus]XP_023240952.1 piggyBac transposable element-derived protein 4-like [Centruroides sculpturatus]XP_023240953.1 piggyBac transposable element-derived protein 4-like [Centruroides sculpturatus]XP_023240954.1 piggyBac transposabl